MTQRPKRLEDIQPDTHNANKGTERGAYQLETSLRKYGAGRSILIDKNGVAIAGNKTLERAVELGFEIEVVESDGKKLVVVQRTDLDLSSDPAARELAYADNRVGQVSLEWDTAVMVDDLQAGVDLSDFWRKEELDTLLGMMPDPGDADQIVMPELWGVIVECSDEQEQVRLLERFSHEGLHVRALL